MLKAGTQYTLNLLFCPATSTFSSGTVVVALENDTLSWAVRVEQYVAGWTLQDYSAAGVEQDLIAEEEVIHAEN